MAIGPPSGGPSFGTSRESSSDRFDLVQRAGAADIQRPLARPAEREVLAVGRRALDWNGAEVPPLFAQHLDAAAGRDVEPAVVVDRHAVGKRPDPAEPVVTRTAACQRAEGAPV